jgi:hypothetical protein
VYALLAPINPEGGPDFPRTAVILGAAAGYLVLAGCTGWRASQLRQPWLAVTVAACAVAGMTADLPAMPSWHTLSYAAFGASAFMTLVAAAEPDRDTSS